MRTRPSSEPLVTNKNKNKRRSRRSDNENRDRDTPKNSDGSDPALRRNGEESIAETFRWWISDEGDVTENLWEFLETRRNGSCDEVERTLGRKAGGEKSSRGDERFGEVDELFDDDFSRDDRERFCVWRFVVDNAAVIVGALSTIMLLVAVGLVLRRDGHDGWPNGVEGFAGGPVKYSTRIVKTRYGSLRGIVTRDNELEAYLGVPYATPPLGALRYMPPVTPTQWRGIKPADSMPPACPQRIPENEANLPRRRRAYLERVSPMLANQSEDCLYLNLYVPRSSHGEL